MTREAETVREFLPVGEGRVFCTSCGSKISNSKASKYIHKRSCKTVVEYYDVTRTSKYSCKAECLSCGWTITEETAPQSMLHSMKVTDFPSLLLRNYQFMIIPNLVSQCIMYGQRKSKQRVPIPSRQPHLQRNQNVFDLSRF